MIGNDKVIFEGMIKILKVVSESVTLSFDPTRLASLKKVIDLLVDIEKHTTGLKE